MTIGNDRDEFYSNTVTVGGGNPPQPPPDPTPDPPPPNDPPPASGCTPTTTLLQFDGGYRVSMCYVTPNGTVGQAGAGVWASGKAGILWFFDRENAEVLVKVLDGCSNNGHRWAFVAPVTDLEFNLWVTGPNGKRWTHSNRQGATASTKADIRAFSCSDESDGGGDGGDGGGDGDDGGGGSSAPDLVVSSPSVSDSSLSAGGRFTLRATVRNQGDGRSASTTLRYYRSSNSGISSSDTQVGTDSVGALSASGSSAESISLTAPSSAGTWYYGACVDAVSGESNTGNNCSSGVRVTVSEGGGDGSDAATLSRPECSADQTADSTWDATITGSITAHRSLRNVRVQGYIEPGRRQIGNQLLGSIAASETRTFNMTGTVSGATPTSCRVEARFDAGVAVLRISAPMEREERVP